MPWALRGGCRERPAAVVSCFPGWALPMSTAVDSPAGLTFEKATLHPAETSAQAPYRILPRKRESSFATLCLFSPKSPMTFRGPRAQVTMVTIGDDVFDTAPTAVFIVTIVTYRHPEGSVRRSSMAQPVLVRLLAYSI